MFMFMLDKYVDLKVDVEVAMMTIYYYLFYSEYFDGNFVGKSPHIVPAKGPSNQFKFASQWYGLEGVG
jgi:hypothetical protein